MPKTPEERASRTPLLLNSPKLTLPGNARLAVWVIVNVENWEIRRPMPRTVLPPPLGMPLSPDLPNWPGTNIACESVSGVSWNA